MALMTSRSAKSLSTPIGEDSGLHQWMPVGLDQTGLSQKAGPVVSDVRITIQAMDGGVSGASGSSDVLLGLDVIASAAAHNLSAADPRSSR